MQLDAKRWKYGSAAPSTFAFPRLIREDNQDFRHATSWHNCVYSFHICQDNCCYNNNICFISWSQNCVKITKINYRDQNLFCCKAGNNTSAGQFQAIPSTRSQAFSRKPQIYHISWSQSYAPIGEINRLWPGWPGHMSWPNFRPYFPCVLQKMPGNL